MVASILTVLTFAHLQMEKPMFNPAENYGKSASQVVSMGYQAWYDLVMENDGPETTLSMSGANYSYGCALYDVNSQNLKSLGKEKQDLIKELRPRALEFRNKCVELGIAVSGGGSLWTIVGSGNLMRSEEMISELISQKKIPSKKNQSEVWKILESTQERLTKARADIDASEQYTGRGYRDADGLLKELQFEWKDILPKIAKIKSVRDRGIIIHFYYDSLELVQFMDEKA